MKIKQVFFLLVGVVAPLLGYSQFTGSSSLVSSGPNGLVYATYANQNQANAVNTVPDFSMAGYQGGGVTIPFVPAAVTVRPSGGDDTAAIQNAIDQVSSLPVRPSGFRGAVVLAAGDYTVSRTLSISTSGVVVRGAGSQADGGTKITYTATAQSDVFSVSGGSGPSEIGGTRRDITDSFVPVGARTLTISNASGYAPGDSIMVQMTVNQKWLDDLSNMSQWGWSVNGYQLRWRHTVTAVNGNTLTIDSPMVQTLEDPYGGGDVYKYRANLLENIGIEAMRVESTYFHIADEQHGRYAVAISRLKNGWVRQLTASHFVQGAVRLSSSSRFITVEDCAALDHISMISGGRRYSFSIDDAQNLFFQRCLTREGRHDFVSGSRTPGPNAFVDSRADNPHSDIGPHHRYATGQIYDNIKGGAINGGKNSRAGGSGHGWTGAQIMLWNCVGSTLKSDAPNGAMNWSVGSTGQKVGDGSEPFGIWDSHNIPVTPRSLYYAQLVDRLGINAMNSVILPQQKTETVWDELHAWGGDGLFLDELIVLADEENTPAVDESLDVRGIVRNLQMLDRGATFAWRKVYGPGTAVFADGTALETTVSFSRDGAYLLELSVDDGVAVVKGAVIVEVGAGSVDITPPATPANLAVTTDASSVQLDWTDNSETDLAGYDVFRSSVPGEAGVAIAYGLTSSGYTDSSAEKGVRYYYTVRAVDTNSNVSVLSAEAAAMVNALPTVEIMNPVDGETVNFGDSLAVQVDASDRGGLIANVELFLNGQSVGQDTASPYEWGSQPLLQNLAVGTHDLSAVATDDQGTSSTDSITITVEVDVTPPAAPRGLVALANYGSVSLEWEDNTERDLVGYKIYRSTVPGSFGAALTQLTDSFYQDMELAGGIPYYYKITAIDANGLESVASSEVSVTPMTVQPGMILFGTNNDGLGGFTHTSPNATQIWSTQASSVQYRNENIDLVNASLLKAFPLDRSNGKSYTLEALITLSNGYPEDNARVGVYLFGDSDQIPGDSEAGALYIHRNFEGGGFTVTEGIQRATVAEAYHGRVKDYSWFGEDIHISVSFTFNGANIDLTATLTDARETVTTVSASVPAASYTGDYFGFATRSRTRDFGADPPTIKSAPFTMDYRTFWLADDDRTEALLSLSPGSRSHGDAAVTGKSVSVFANVDWSAGKTEAWIDLGNSAGSGDGTFTYDLSENTLFQARSGIITVSGGGLTETFTVEQAGATADLSEVLGLESGSATTGGDAPWVVVSGVPTSGAISDSQESWVEAEFDGPGVLAFDWKVSSELNYDFLEIYVNGERRERISGEVDWQAAVIALATGTQTVRWSYGKDPNRTVGDDIGSVRNVEFTAGALELGLDPASRAHDAAPADKQIVSVSGNVPWTASCDDADWITLGTSSGVNDGTITYAVAANASTETRLGIITVSGGGLTQLFTVEQAGSEPTGPADTWYNGAEDLGGDWRWLPWLRSFNISQAPWIYHAQHRWMYPFGDDPAAGIYFWDHRQQAFIYTTSSLYPTMYRFSDRKWIRYLVGSRDPRWFVDLVTAVWEQVE